MSRQATKGDLLAIARRIGLDLPSSVTTDRVCELVRARLQEVQAAIAVLHPEIAETCSTSPVYGDRLVVKFLAAADARRADPNVKVPLGWRAAFQPVRTAGDAARELGVNVADVNRRSKRG